MPLIGPALRKSHLIPPWRYSPMSAQRHRRFGMESLERRTLMAADLLNGTLTVVGTNGNDNIQVQVAVGGLHAGELQVDVNSEQRFFDVNLVNSIHIAGLAGN